VLTARGWWFVSTAMVIGILGVVRLGWWSATIPLLGLTLLILFFLEWLRFAIQYRSTTPALRVSRQLIQAGCESPAVWANIPVHVRVEITATSGYTLPLVVVDDIPALDRTEDSPAARTAGPLGPDTPLLLEYVTQFEQPGLLRFEGIQLRLSDRCGFFYRRLVVRDAREWLILPTLVSAEGTPTGIKRLNSMPPPGGHRHRRAGTGSELLDLRDYRPGDPPKTIAWRASARRDKLITREFESEVPVRCTLFIDATTANRRATAGGIPLARMAQVAAAVAQAAMANRDLVGVTVYDEEATISERPGRTHSHLIRLLRLLAETAGRLPALPGDDPVKLGQIAFPLAQRIYPELLESYCNARPLGLFWLPVADSRLFWVVVMLMAWPFLAVQPAVLELLARFAQQLSEPGRSWQILLLFLVLPGWLAAMFWLIHGIRGWFASRRRATSQRKQLAALFTVLDAEPPLQIERYLNDDRAWMERCRQFLELHRFRAELDPRTQPLPGNPSLTVVEILARALWQTAARAQDNELYVLLADLSEQVDALTPVLNAIRFARARHHQLIVLAVEPVPPIPANKSRSPRLRYLELLQEWRYRELARRFERLQSLLVKAGVTLIPLNSRDAVPAVLNRLDRIRGIQVRR